MLRHWITTLKNFSQNNWNQKILSYIKFEDFLIKVISFQKVCQEVLSPKNLSPKDKKLFIVTFDK